MPAVWNFHDKVVLVTGASQGIGAVTAQMFAENGADVVIAARRPDELERRAELIRSTTGRRCLAVVADVTDPEQVKTMVDRALEAFGGIDILINNAGNSVRSSLRKLTPEVWQWGRALNLDSAAYCTMEVGKHFLERKAGVIVNISSVAGISGTMGEVPYSAGKAGIQMLTRVAAAEWGPHGIRVNCVAPGMTATEKMKGRLEAGVYNLEEVSARFPLRRPGTCEEVAYAILFFASDYASYITGQTLAVDGGPTIAGFTD
ncbi:SDR family NAD(P)-dependent oxidoreductase [Phenylobacterium sp. LjRoot219]|uniref:SDR family NAD(P)-dependent oxidoreductase n=1 Tax=Phenylobacterium sp. LjRoot219 TaxID=3342283 RepID=UPI003ECDA944